LLIGSVYLYDANPKRWLLSVILALFGRIASAMRTPTEGNTSQAHSL
jgi:hypothetical protein